VASTTGLSLGPCHWPAAQQAPLLLLDTAHLTASFLPPPHCNTHAHTTARSLHPSLFGKDKELAAGVQAPVLLVAAKGDPLETVKEVLDGREGLGDKCVYWRMDDMTVSVWGGALGCVSEWG